MDLKSKITRTSIYDAHNRIAQIYCSWVLYFFQAFFKNFNFYSNGVRNSLEIEDLARCAQEDESKLLYQRFERNYSFWRSKLATYSMDGDDEDISISPKTIFHKFFFIKLLRRNLFLLTIIQTFKNEALAPFLLSFMQDCIIKPFQPILIGIIIRYFYGLTNTSEREPLSLSYCLCITVALCVSSLLLIACHHPSLQLAMKLSMRIKIVWSSLIYNKSLELSVISLKHKNLSHLINLMTNDVRRLDEFLILFSYLLIVPVQIVLILLISWYYIGFSCLATFFAFLILSYLLTIFGKRLANYRTKSIVHTESRLKILNEIFRHLRAIKIFTLEDKFIAKTINLRRIEMKALKFPIVLRSIILSFSMVSSRVIMYFSFMIYLFFLDTNENVYPETVFVSVSLFERLRYSLTWTFPLAISGLQDILASCARMNSFLQQASDSDSEHAVKRNLNGTIISKVIGPQFGNSKKGIFISNLNSCNTIPGHLPQSNEISKFGLQNVSLSIEPGQTVSVVGLVGSGKSTLLLTILSEIESFTADKFEVNGTLAYVSQEAYTLNATIRENILFGRKFDPSRYKQVLDICALETDLESLPLGDQSLVGESGLTLSGGQRARINLARALYSDKDIYLLDDPFSSVDAHLARHIFHRCIECFLRDKCVLLATHQLHFIPSSTNILFLDNGKPLAYGKFDSLMAENIAFAKFFNLTKCNNENENAIIEHQILLRERTKNEDDNGNVCCQVRSDSLHDTKSKNISAISPEIGYHNLNVSIFDRKTSFSQKGIIVQYWNYLKVGSSGLGSINLVILTAILSQVFLYICDYWLTQWNQEKFDRLTFFVSYTLIIFAIIVFAILRSVTFYELCLRASERTHNEMIRKIIQAPIYCFDYISIGNMLNYFSRDIGILDETLPSALFELNLAFFQVISVICLIILLFNPYLIFGTFIYLFLLFWARNFYSLPSRVLREFEVKCRSRIFAHLSSTLSGIITIRSYSMTNVFRDSFFRLLDDHTSIVFLQLSSSRLFCTIIDTFSFFYILIILCVFFVFSNRSSGNGLLIGHCLSSVFNLIGVVQWAVKRSVDSDHWIMSFHNLSLFDSFPNEKDEDGFKHLNKLNWNESTNKKKEIVVKNLSVYYQHPQMSGIERKMSRGEWSSPSEETIKFVLNNVNFLVNAGENIGICGRSGAGKSSLVNAFLRLNRHIGKIYVGELDIECYTLTDLRRHISVIPQFPVIFSGSIRENLDLFNRFSDEELWSVLDQVQLRPLVESLEHGLEQSICMDFPQMSLGQKQLICLARVMLQNNRLVILDEATASVDLHTDKLIQQTIRNKFSDCTVLTIAHRIESIINCDRILVFNNGELVEDDSPSNLLANSKSYFAQLVKKQTPKLQLI